MAEPAVKTEKGEWLSESEIGKRVKLNRQTVAMRLENLGYKPDEERSTAKAKIHWFDEEMAFALRAATDEFQALKIRGMRAEARSKELKYERERGELVSMTEARDLAFKLIDAIYQEFKVRQPKRIQQKLARARTPIEVKKILNADAEWVMKRVRENVAAFIK